MATSTRGVRPSRRHPTSQAALAAFQRLRRRPTAELSPRARTRLAMVDWHHCPWSLREPHGATLRLLTLDRLRLAGPLRAAPSGLARGPSLDAPPTPTDLDDCRGPSAELDDVPAGEHVAGRELLPDTAGQGPHVECVELDQACGRVTDRRAADGPQRVALPGAPSCASWRPGSCSSPLERRRARIRPTIETDRRDPARPSRTASLSMPQRG